ncbi:MAG: arginine-ornithine antiporter, partial [Lactococcus lactis]
ELIATFVLTVLGILAVFGVYGNWLGLQDALGIDGNTLLVAVVPLIVVTFIVYFVVRSDINKKEIKN